MGMMPEMMPEDLIRRFDSALSQAWMTPTEDGFEIHATKLWKTCRKHKIFGYFPERIGGSREHLSRVEEAFPDYLQLALHENADPKQEYVDDLPF